MEQAAPCYIILENSMIYFGKHTNILHVLRLCIISLCMILLYINNSILVIATHIK